jgi:hypothetical protein
MRKTLSELLVLVLFEVNALGMLAIISYSYSPACWRIRNVTQVRGFRWLQLLRQQGTDLGTTRQG